MADFSNPVFMNAAGTQIDVTTPEGIRTTITATDPSADFWAAVVAGSLGPVAAYQPPDLTPFLRQFADAERIKRVVLAYAGEEKRSSAYGYLGQLAALSASKSITADQKKDLATLLAAQDWEQAMINRVGEILATPGFRIEALYADETWVTAPSGLNALALTC